MALSAAAAKAKMNGGGASAGEEALLAGETGTLKEGPACRHTVWLLGRRLLGRRRRRRWWWFGRRRPSLLTAATKNLWSRCAEPISLLLLAAHHGFPFS